MFPQIKKGSILRIVHDNILAIEKQESILSDYLLTENLSKLNISSNRRFYINVLVDTKYWLQIQDIEISISQKLNNTLNIFNFTTAFSDNGYSLNKFFKISKCKI